MRIDRIVLLGMLGVLSAPQASVAARAPDAHVIRPVRGDIMDVRTEAAKPAAHGPYVAPRRGWRYSAKRPGDRLPPAFYARRYVVTDPPALAPARGRQRWIRYGPDLLLVDARNGRVVRVVRNRYAAAVGSVPIVADGGLQIG